VGVDTVRHCTASGDEVIATDRSSLDVTDRDAVLAAVTSLRPDVVIHCAAHTAVDRCEGEVAAAFAVNALAVRHVADAARRAGAHLVSVSTDYVFDGTAGRPYHEWDEPNPLSVYGRSKLAGEREAVGAGGGATVVRTSWLCGANGSNMVKTVVRLLDEGVRPLRFVDDQYGCPTFTADLAVTLRRIAVARLPGVVHVTNHGETTWYGFARAVVAAAGADPGLVEPITTAQLHPPRPAPRPADSRLASLVLPLPGLPALRPFEDALAETVAELRS
jgi:dTDP-4-dehydrorhamnose reductase